MCGVGERTAFPATSCSHQGWGRSRIAEHEDPSCRSTPGCFGARGPHPAPPGQHNPFGAGPAPGRCSHPGGMCSHFPAPCTTPSPVTPPGIQGEQGSGILDWIRALQRAPGAGDGGGSSTPTCWLRSLPAAARHTEPPQLLLATKGCRWPVASKSPAAASLLLVPAQMLEAVKILINHK